MEDLWIRIGIKPLRIRHTGKITKRLPVLVETFDWKGVTVENWSGIPTKPGNIYTFTLDSTFVQEAGELKVAVARCKVLSKPL